MGSWRLLITTAILLEVFVPTYACPPRRSPPSCSKKDCTYNQWSAWSTCTAKCGYVGLKSRTRGKKSDASCGGSCANEFKKEVSCPNTCCPIDCSYVWLNWSPCDATCGYGKRTRKLKINSDAKCKGKPCPSQREEKETCGDGRCCPVNCVLGSWGAWGTCSAACERSGQRTRSRPITTSPSCGGTGCPSRSASKSCSGPCCPRDCVMSSWTAWTKCSSSSCKTNSGTQTRTRRVATQASCSGTCTQPTTASQRCTPIPVTCQITSWTSWQACVATNGKCGGGTQKRTRRITRASYCSPACPAKTSDSRSCVHSCCPIACVVNPWSSWSVCSSTCGQGNSDRTRTVQRPPSCGGTACGDLSQSKSCTQYINQDCVMEVWSAWSVCDNGCGTGRAKKTRKITQQPVCRGKKCSYLEAFKACTDYRNNRDCKVGRWTSWGNCDQTCTVGNKARTRVITQNKQCQGKTCPTLKESTQCGSPNNGCEHKCTNGICSCNAGYNLVGSKQCIAKDCGKLTLTYCATGTQKGTTCKYATVSCPNNQTTFPVVCSVVCPSTYALKGVSSVTCTAAGSWTSTAATYCRRINDPPTKIVLSGSHSISENKPRSTRVGVLTSVDPNPRDSHKYTLRSGGEGKFAVMRDKLYTTMALDYERMNKRYDLTIRSTDNGNPPLYMDKVITLTLTDVNEPPTDIQISNSQIQENSDIDTVVGVLSTADQDTSQAHSYTLLDTASGRFKIDGKILKVAISNADCLTKGEKFCSLNYEQQPSSHRITVRSTDNGNPPLSINVSLLITLTDVNDQPRKLSLSGNTVKENATNGAIIGKFSAHDEDHGQSVSYYLSDDDNGRFAVSSDGNLTKVLGTDYETSKVHRITAVVKDNGIPMKQMNKSFVIEVLDVNEPPIDISLTDKGGQLSFQSNNARVNENSTIDTVVGTLEARDSDASQNLTFNLDIDPLQSFSLAPAVCTHGNNTVCKAVMTVSGELNHEVNPYLEIAVRVTDQHGSFIIQKFNISVEDSNDRPSNVTISGSLEASVPENNPGAFIGELVTSDEDQSQTHSYTIKKNGDIFEVRRGKFLYLKNKPLDFETKNKYVVMVTSTDNGSPPMTSPTQSFTVHVTDRNEAPVTIALSNEVVPENSPSGTIIGNFTIDDPDNFGNFPSRQSHVCRLTDSAQGKFQVVLKNGQNFLGQAVSFLDYEKAISHKIRVLCTDPHGLSNQTDFDVIVSDVNEAPIKVVLSNTQVVENRGPGVVGLLTTVDPDNANNQSKQSFRYTLRSVGSSPFVVDGDVLNTTRSLDYENARSWFVVVRAQDSGKPSLYRDVSFVVDVVDDNDRPSAIQLSNVQVKENSGVDTVVGNLATSDEDVGQNHTYKLIDGAGGRFKIDGSLVKVAISNTLCLQHGYTSCQLNYEVQASYNITVRTIDNGIPAKTFDQTFTVYLNDDNDRPRDLALTNDVVHENEALGTVIGAFTARDEDKRQKLSFSLVNDDGGRFVLNGNKLVTAKKLDHEADKRHFITVAVVDNGYNALKLERNFTIEVLNINEAPIAVNFTGAQPPAVLENTTVGRVVGSLHALDTDANQDLNFTLDDDSQGEFSLQNTNCQSLANDRNTTSCKVELVLSKPLNYEIDKERLIAVRVTDNHGLFRVQKFSINVTDCNDAPTDITLGGGLSAVVHENSNGALVGELETSDEDSSQIWVYHLLDDFEKLFNVTGKYIYVNEGRHLDYESQAMYTLRVRSVDNGAPAYSVTRNFTIVVTDINEAPTNITLSAKEIFENSAPGTVIANLTIADPDNVGTIQQGYSCVVIGQNMLRINSGQLVSSVEFNFETTAFVNASIECTDTGKPPLKYREDFTVSIRDRNEAPSDVILSSLSVLENKASGVIATIATIDPDNEVNDTKQTFSYQFIPPPSRDFPFKIQGGNLSTTRALDHEAAPSWNFTLQSLDNGKPAKSVSRSFVISVQDINEVPSKITLSPDIVNENPEQGTLVGKLTATDQDRGQSHRFSLLDSAAGRFKLVNNSEIRVAVSNKNCLLHGGKNCLLNYETESVYSIRVRAMDDGIPPLHNTSHININLADVNDQPRDLALSRNWVDENVAVNTSIGYFNASDEDNRLSHSQNLTYRCGLHGLFGVDPNGRLFVAKPIDHEKSSTAVVTVNVTDSGHPPKGMEKQFTIIIRNANEAPLNTTLTQTGGQQSYSDDHPTINENSVYGETVGTLLSLDQDAGQHLTFTLDDDAGGRFSVNKTTTTCHNGTSDPVVKTICSCELVVSGSLNYENVSRHAILVRVSDGNHSRVSYFSIEVLDQNDAPDNVTIQGSLSGRVKENANEELIGELVTSDEDGSQSHVYALKGADARRFTIKGSKLYTSPDANLNYEEQQEFEIVFVSTDNGSRPLSVKQNLTIKIEDVNESPSNITLSGLTISENSLTGTFVANITVDDPDNHGPKGAWQTHSCRLIDSAQDRFKIPSKTNTLLVSTGVLNHELSSSHGVLIQCTDSASKPLAAREFFEIQVININERPELIVLSNKEVPENGGPLFVGDLNTRDPDKTPVQSFEYSLVSANEENVFYIAGSKLMTSASLDYERRSTWDLVIETADQGGLNLTQNFTISVRDTNDRPTDILTSLPLAVSENSNAGSSVAVFTAVDEDAGQTHRFFITNITAFGHGSDSIGYQTAFELDSTSGRLIVASHVDYENVTKFNMGIMTQDSGYPHLTLNKKFILEVLDINEPPSDLQLNNSQIAENSAEGSVVGSLSVEDPDNINGDKQFYTCEVVNNVPFKVSQMQLLVAEAILDFENRSDYSLTINCTQNGNSSFYIHRSFLVDVTDVNEAPYNLILNGTSVKENQPEKTFVGNLFAADHDINDTITFKFSDPKSDGSSKFYINGTSLLTSVEFNYEVKSTYLISVVAKDDGTPSLSQIKQFRITIKDINDEPIKILFNSSGIEENAIQGTVVGNLTTDDPDKHNTHNYTLLNHNSIFYISGDKLLVNDSGLLDYESKTKVQILVKTTDNGTLPKSLKENITVHILDANDKPYNITSESLSVNENTQGHTAVVFYVSDQDVNQSHSCYIQDSVFFDMDSTPNHSVLRVKYGSVLDHERNSTISINVSCTDNGLPPLTISKLFEIKIVDVNESPTDFFLNVLNGSYEVDEIAYVGYSLGDLICADPDRDQTCSFQVIGKFNDTFNVTKDKNLLTVISNVKLDYEKLDSPVINVTIRAMDDGQPPKSFTKDLNITVNEINEGMNEINLKLDQVVFNETTPIGTNISELVCNNPEKWQILDYVLVNHSIFKIVKSPYNATYDPPILNNMGVKQRTFEQYKSFLHLNETFYNYDVSPRYDILVRVTDNGRPPKSYIGNVFVDVSKVDPCLPENNCSLNANCSRVDGFSYNCLCHDGFEGNGYNCTNIDDCLNSTKWCGSIEPTTACPPCKNNATCHDQLLQFNCTCLPGYEGEQCGNNIDECDSRNFNYSCDLTHSTCIDRVNNIKCDCHRGFADWLCDRNIDDCVSDPCGNYGECVDHIDSYECECHHGYTGSRCDRLLGDKAEECAENDQLYVPYPIEPSSGNKESGERESGNNGERNTNNKEAGEHESGNTYPVEESIQDVCFSGKNITTLKFDKELLNTLKKAGISSLNDDVISAMRIEVEDWLKRIIQVWYTYVGSFKEGGFYNLTDVSVLHDSLEFDDNDDISVFMIARVGVKALSSSGFLCSLNHTYPLNNCPKDPERYPDFTSKNFKFIDYLCPTIKNVESLNCTIPGANTDALHGNKGESVLPKWAIYLLVSVGAALFLFVVLFACFADRSQKMNFQKAMRNRQQYDHVRLPEEDDEHYRDVMFRHHISTITQGDGEVNPIYGFDEDEAEMVPNPLYGMSRGIESPPTGHRAFANPLYSTLEREPGLRAKPVGKDDMSY